MALDAVSNTNISQTQLYTDDSNRPEVQADPVMPSTTQSGDDYRYDDTIAAVADTGARTLVAMDNFNSRINVESNSNQGNNVALTDNVGGANGFRVAGQSRITCSDDPATEQQCRDMSPRVVPAPTYKSYVPNIQVAPDTYQGNPVTLGQGAKAGDKIAGFSQQDSRWASLPYTWAPGVPLTGWGSQKGTWGDHGGLGGIGCTATAFTNGLRAVNPNSGVTPANAAKLDSKFWNTVENTNFRDLSGQGKQVNSRHIENSTNWLTGYQQGPKMEQIDPVKVNSPEGKEITNNIRQSLQEGKPVLVGFRNDDGKSIRHSSLAVGFANGQVQILDSETGKVGPMNEFLTRYGYNNAKYDYAYEMSSKK